VKGWWHCPQPVTPKNVTDGDSVKLLSIGVYKSRRHLSPAKYIIMFNKLEKQLISNRELEHFTSALTFNHDIVFFYIGSCSHIRYGFLNHHGTISCCFSPRHRQVSDLVRHSCKSCTGIACPNHLNPGISQRALSEFVAETLCCCSDTLSARIVTLIVTR
jgi:hypothetical protein